MDLNDGISDSPDDGRGCQVLRKQFSDSQLEQGNWPDGHVDSLEWQDITNAELLVILELQILGSELPLSLPHFLERSVQLQSLLNLHHEG